jgi:hypothetical protein
VTTPSMGFFGRTTRVRNVGRQFALRSPSRTHRPHFDLLDDAHFAEISPEGNVNNGQQGPDWRC